MIIYKYMPFSEERLKAMRENQLWMSLPETFNDPFDCDHPIKTDMSHEDSLDVIAKIGSRDVGELLEHTELTKTLIKNHVADYFRGKLRNVGVCCFSRCWNSVAMWSHYADSHRGICLGYDAGDLDGYEFEPVVYQDYPPNIHAKDIAFNFNTAVSQYVFTKKLEWDREEEMRLVRLLGGKGLVNSPMSLDSVIFGLRTSLENEAKIKVMLKNRGVSFFKINKKEGTFELKKEER